MFVYDFVQLEAPFEEVRDRLLQRRAGWLQPRPIAPDHAVEATAESPDDDHDGAIAAERVTLEFERAVEKEEMIAIPFQWRTHDPSPLFTVLDGHLEVSRLGASRTHVSLLGNYEPPSGYFGQRTERMGLHHLAEARLRVFLRRVADCLAGTAETVAG